MSHGHAPLWVRCHDLCQWLFAHIAEWPPAAAELIGRRLFDTALDVWCAVALARAFRARRRLHLRDADEALARLRTLAALAPFEAAADLHLGQETAVIGRMLGGWRKKLGPDVEANEMAASRMAG